MIVLLLFFLSGATALVYEVLWSKYLGLLFGSTIQAQTVVLAVFMGGLALGNKLFGRRADHSERPLVLYGGIEFAIGIYALLFPSLYNFADHLFAALGSNLLDRTGWLLALKGALSCGLLLAPTILMGGTLPLLASWLKRNTTDSGRGTALFYSINSLGAVFGAALAGFVLIESFGVRSTLHITAVANLVVGLMAVFIGSTSRQLAGGQGPAETELSRAVPVEVTAGFLTSGCAVVALTGGISMSLEVLASRCLSLILGASLQVFSLVLMAFIFGISVGSALISSRRKLWPREITTALLLLGAAGFVGVLVFNIEKLAGFYAYAQGGLSRTDVGYRYHQFLAAVISMLVLGFPAAALGSVLPLWIRLSGTSTLLGDKVGRLLTWNTIGAVCGVLLTGFVLMPGIGLRGSFTTLAFLMIGGALAITLTARRWVAAMAAAVVCVLVAIGAVHGGEGWRYAMSSGVFRLPDQVYTPAFLAERRKSVDLLFYEDAADATVSIERDVVGGIYTNLTLRINGKPDASSPGDLSTQLLLGQLPLMMKPDSKDVFCLGMGSGISAGTTLGYPIEHLTVADNCEPVLRAAKFFEPWNSGVLTNSRSHIYHEDARTVLKLNPKKYDVIISEPSNPWMVGIGGVFSREFYDIAASRLKPGGIMSQWLYTYELDDNVLELVVRTFRSVFPAMEIWDVGEGDIVILGSDRPWKSDMEVYSRAFELARPKADLASIGLTSPKAVLARQFASQRTAFALPGRGRIQSDNFPILEYEAPRKFYMFLGRGAQQFQNFDERTWQCELAAPEKRQALAGMDLQSLNTIFGSVAPSVNHDLQGYVRNRLGGGDGNMVFGTRVMPCVFQPTSAETMLFAPASAKTNAVTQQLYSAEAALRTDPSKLLEATKSIQGVLDSIRDYNPEKFDWSAAYYADLAIKASLRLGDAAMAKAILTRALELEPASEQLKYLLRLQQHGGFKGGA